MDIPILNKPSISDSDLDELNGLLEMRAVPFKGMSLEMLDGFLSALAVGPDLVLPSEWTPLVWGGRPPRWENDSEAEHVNGLLLGLWNDVVRRIVLDPEDLQLRDTPLIAMPEQDETEPEASSEFGFEWACGFLDGVELRPEAWDAYAGSERWIDEALLCVEALAAGEWPALKPEAEAEKLSESDRLDLIGGIPHMLHELNLHRLEQLKPHQPIRKAPTPGRNDPCPCDSGRKYKKCCGAGGQ